MSATLGGLLKDYRLQKNLSQLEIAFAMGWKEPSRLSRIEQGKTKKPTREIINRLILIMKLNRSEKGQLLFAGGYLPTIEEIEEIKKEIRFLIDQWSYPAYLLDFSWRLLDWNKPTNRVYDIEESSENKIKKEMPWSAGLAFSPEFPQNKYLKDEKEIERWQKVLLGKLIRFKIINKNNASEKWYQDLLKGMMKNELFAKLWQKAQLSPEHEDIANYERKILVDPKNINNRFDFHILRSPLLQDIRFEINYHIPGDLETFRYFHL